MKTIFLTLVFSGLIVQAYSQASLDVSAGLVAQTYNRVQIPNGEGTAFDLYKDFQIQGPVIYRSEERRGG